MVYMESTYICVEPVFLLNLGYIFAKFRTAALPFDVDFPLGNIRHQYQLEKLTDCTREYFERYSSNVLCKKIKCPFQICIEIELTTSCSVLGGHRLQFRLPECTPTDWADATVLRQADMIFRFLWNLIDILTDGTPMSIPNYAYDCLVRFLAYIWNYSNTTVILRTAVDSFFLNSFISYWFCRPF